MIQVKNAEDFRICNICCSKKNVKNITFLYDGTKQGSQVALCEKCINELLNKISTNDNKTKEAYWLPVVSSKERHECSNCHVYALSLSDGDEKLSFYCPNCGATMKF